jgi:hypothetical protein
MGRNLTIAVCVGIFMGGLTDWFIHLPKGGPVADMLGWAPIYIFRDLIPVPIYIGPLIYYGALFSLIALCSGMNRWLFVLSLVGILSLHLVLGHLGAQEFFHIFVHPKA